jgi:hypothetical protein
MPTNPQGHAGGENATIATERLVDHLQEYLRSGLGTPKITVLINPLLAELQELRQYLYDRSKWRGEAMSEKAAKTCPDCGSSVPSIKGCIECFTVLEACYPTCTIGPKCAHPFHDPAPREATEEELRAQRAGYVRAEMAFGTDRQEAEEREATEEAPQLDSRILVSMLYRCLARLHLAVKGCAAIGFQESSPTTNEHHASIWNDLNEAQKDAELKLKHYLTPAAPPPAAESLYRVPITRLLVPSAVDEATEGFNAIFPWVPQAEDENGNLLTLADKIEILGKQYDDLLDVKPATESELRSQPEAPSQSSGVRGWDKYWASLDKDSQDKLASQGLEAAQAWFVIGSVWGAAPLPGPEKPEPTENTMDISREYLHLKIALLDMQEQFEPLLSADNGNANHLSRVRAMDRAKKAVEHAREVQTAWALAESPTEQPQKDANER